MSSPLAVLGRIPSGIFILTSGTGEQATGMLASWVMQSGFDPPMVTVAVRHGRYVGDWLTAGQPFALNVVAADQHRLLKHFAKGFEPGEPAFDGLQTVSGTLGPTLLVDAVGHLECRPKGHVDSGDHRVFLAEVVAGRLQGDAAPMVHIRTSGSHY
ncbi:MAG TPA: flavin reductase family protein [Lacipirellulaceae bacterium]|nr:flavin reductase family protein [Lacipirellulaceae bacterium]